MALITLSPDSTPMYLITETSDIVDNKVSGASFLGKTLFDAEGGDWYIISTDGELAAYAIPASFSGSIALGTVDQGDAGAEAWLVDGSGVTQPISGNVGRISTTVTPTAQASTASSVIVVGSNLDTLNTLTVSYTIKNTGAESIDWIVYGANASNFSDKVVVNASATITAGSTSSYSTTLAVFRYYGVYIVDTVGGNHGEATIIGITKG